MSKEIEEIKSELEALALKIEQLEASEFEFCGDGHTVYCDGGIGKQTVQKTKDFAAINKTKDQAIKRRRMLYLQNVEFQLAEHFNEGEVCGWDDGSPLKYFITFNHYTKEWFIGCNHAQQRLGVSHFISKEAAEKSLPYYIEAVERYDRGEV